MRIKKKLRAAILSYEVLLAIVAMAIFSAVGSMVAPNFLENGRNARALNDTAALASLVAEYKMEVGTYPSSLTDLTAKKGQYGPWIVSIPVDPWNRSYGYKFSSSEERFAVYSKGRKGTDASTHKSIGNGNIGYIGR